jgi:hypothetical protein
MLDTTVREAIIPSLVRGFPQRDSSGNFVNALKSSVIITSNFKHMGVTQGWTRAEVRKYVQNEALTFFEEVIQENVIVVPLVAYTESDFRAIAHQMMQNELCESSVLANFECLVYPSALVDDVASAVWNDKEIRTNNGRAVWNSLGNKVLWIARDTSLTDKTRSARFWGDSKIYDLVFHLEDDPVSSLSSNGSELQGSSVSRLMGSHPTITDDL